MRRISPAIDAPDGVLRLDGAWAAPSLCVLVRNADASARSARTHDPGHRSLGGTGADVGGAETCGISSPIVRLLL